MSIDMEFDASEAILDPIGDDEYLLEFIGGMFKAEILIVGKENLQGLYQEILTEVTHQVHPWDPHLAGGDYFEPQEIKLGKARITAKIGYGAIQIYPPSDNEPYWQFIVDDTDTDQQVIVLSGNDVAQQLINALAHFLDVEPIRVTKEKETGEERQ